MASLYIGRFDGYAANSEYGAFNVYFQYSASGITLSSMSIKLSKINGGKYTTNSWYIDSVKIGGTSYSYSPTSGSAYYTTEGAGPTIDISGTHASGSSVEVIVKMHRSGQSASAQTLSGTVTGLATAPTGLWCNVSSKTETKVTLSGGYTSNGGASVTSSGYQYKTTSGSWTTFNNGSTTLSPGTKYYFRYYATNSVGTSYSDGSTNTTTYDYPAITSAPNLTIGNQLTISFSNPRGLKCYVYLILANGNEYGGNNTTGTSIKGYNNSTWLSNWYNSIPSKKSGSYKVRLYVPDLSRNTTVNGGTYSIKDNGTEIPNFSDSNWSYSANLTQLTNNNQCIINGYSQVVFSINTAATSSYGSSISGYNYKWGNQSNNTGTVSGGSGNILEVAAIDSRGLNKSTSKTLTSGGNYVPYTTPILNYSNSYTHRVDGISNETYLTLQGNLSVMKFGTNGVANAIYSVQYKVYDYSTNQWSEAYTIPVNEFTLSSSGYFSLNNYMIHANGSSGGFTVGKRYGIQIILKDAQGLLATLTSNNILVTDGKIAVDCYQDSNGDYHRGINGLASDDCNQLINGTERVTQSLMIPKNSSDGYGLCNSDGMSIIKDYNNQNVTVDATGKVLFLGWRNTTAINILNGKANVDSNGIFTATNIQGNGTTWIALQTTNGNNLRRLQLESTGKVILYSSSNGGSSWTKDALVKESEMYFQPNETLKISEWYGGAYITTNTTTIKFTIPLPKRKGNTTDVSITGGKISVRASTGGYLESDLTLPNSKVVSKYYRDGYITIFIINSSSYSTTNNTPVGIELDELTLKFT